MHNVRTRTMLNTLVVAFGYLMSRLLGVIRDIFITARFGTSFEVDAYRAAFAVPDLIYLVVAGGALGTALIPVYQQYRQHHRETDANALVSSILNLMIPTLLGVSVIAWIWAEPLVAYTTARGFTPAQQQLTAELMRWLLIQPIVLGIGGMFKAVLEAHEQFSLPTIGSNLYNIGIIVGAALFSQWFGIHGIIYGVLIGAGAFTLVQMPRLRHIGFQYVRTAWLHTAGLRDVWQLLIPRLFGQSVWQINIASMIGIISTFGIGAVAASGYAMQLMLLPHGLVGLSIGTVIFPRLASLFAAGDEDAFATNASRALQTVLAVTLPVSITMWYAAPVVVLVLFQRGSFDQQSAILTISAMQGFMVGLAGFCIAEIAVRIWYARKNTRIPVIIGIFAVLFNISAGWALTQSGSTVLRLHTVALVFSIANIVEAVLLVGLLWYNNRTILPFTTLWTWCCGIIGMVVLLQLERFLPALPMASIHAISDIGIVAMHLGIFAVSTMWGIGWCSQGFRFVRQRTSTHS